MTPPAAEARHFAGRCRVRGRCCAVSRSSGGGAPRVHVDATAVARRRGRRLGQRGAVGRLSGRRAAASAPGPRRRPCVSSTSRAERLGAPAPADALVTATPGIALAVVAADCVPVLLADPRVRRRRRCARRLARHRGRRGRRRRPRAMTRQYGVEPSRDRRRDRPEHRRLLLRGRRGASAGVRHGRPSGARPRRVVLRATPTADRVSTCGAPMQTCWFAPACAREQRPCRRPLHQDAPGVVRVVPRRWAAGGPPGGDHRGSRRPISRQPLIPIPLAARRSDPRARRAPPEATRPGRQWRRSRPQRSGRPGDRYRARR